MLVVKFLGQLTAIVDFSLRMWRCLLDQLVTPRWFRDFPGQIFTLETAGDICSGLLPAVSIVDSPGGETIPRNPGVLFVDGPHTPDIIRDIRVQQAIAVDVTALAASIAMCTPVKITDLEEPVIRAPIRIQPTHSCRFKGGLMLGDAHPGGQFLHGKLV